MAPWLPIHPIPFRYLDQKTKASECRLCEDPEGYETTEEQVLVNLCDKKVLENRLRYDTLALKLDAQECSESSLYIIKCTYNLET